MGSCCSKPASDESVALYYCDPSGKLVTYIPSPLHERKDELSFVNKQDNPLGAKDEYYLIHAAWLDDWIEYCNWEKASGKSKKAVVPKDITNYLLVDQVTGLLKPSVALKTDFRPISKKVWEYLFSKYGGGPVIYGIVPENLEPKAYKKGTWTNDINFRDSVKLIYPTDKAPKQSVSFGNEAENPLVSMAIYSLQSDAGASKIRKAKELQKDINEAVKDTVAGTFAKELGKQKFAEAAKKEEEVKAEKTQAAATLFVDDLSESKKRQADESHKQELIAQEQRLVESLKGAGAKHRFKAYLKAGKTKDAEIEAAKMLQGAWRARLARAIMLQKKMEKERLKQEAAAIKLQGRWRIRQSRERVRQLKLQQQRLREEGAAIKLQGAWRIRKAREKVKRLKAEKQRLLEEGAAMMMQAAWRRRLAYQKVGGLRAERERELARKNKAAKILGLIALRFLAKLRYHRRKRETIHILAVTLKSAQGLNSADFNGTSDPYALVQGWHADIKAVNKEDPADAKKSQRLSAQRPLLDGSAVPVCLHTSHVVYKNLNPSWNETCLIPNIHGYDDIVITLADHDMVSRHDFLGQVIIHLADYENVFTGDVIELSLPLQSHKVPSKYANNKDVNLDALDSKANGTINLTLQCPSAAYLQSGWMKKLTKGALGLGVGAEHKNRFFMLTRQKLSYYTDDFSLGDMSKGSIDCEHITSIEVSPDKAGGGFHMSVTAGKEHWQMQFIEDRGLSAEKAKELWLRKLHNCCRNATFKTDNTFKSPSKRGGVFG